MASKIEIGKSVAMANFVSKYAEKMVTPEGKSYYRFPYWFEQIMDDFEFVMHIDIPKDLAECICKAGLGGDNPKIEKVKL